jgi:hypothetical protein
VSLIRLKTSIRGTAAILIASLFFFVPGTEVILDKSWAILLIILTGISVTTSHSLGGSIQSAKYYIASGNVIKQIGFGILIFVVHSGCGV